jgi:hypothetical protein
MDVEMLIDAYPRLYHMAEEGSWSSISERGLWSTSGLLDLFEIDGPERIAIERRRRPESIEIAHPVYGTAVIRDQKPMNDRALQKCLLDGLTPEDWYRVLNARVFFWATRKRLISLLKARAYRRKCHDVLTVDSRSLIARHAHDITLSAYNSGSTVYRPIPRGLSTFRSIAEYPSNKRGRAEKPVAEVAVDHGVRDIRSVVIKVERMMGDEVVDVIWEPDFGRPSV